MVNEIQFSIDAEEREGIYHNGLDIVADSGSYYLDSEIIADDIAQPHWKSPHEGFIHGHVIKLLFYSVENAEDFYSWLQTIADYEEYVPDSMEFRRITQTTPSAVFLYIPGMGDICSAVIDEAAISEDYISLSLYLSVKGSGYDEIEELLPILFGE